jgi:hypothetical protein
VCTLSHRRGRNAGPPDHEAGCGPSGLRLVFCDAVPYFGCLCVSLLPRIRRSSPAPGRQIGIVLKCNCSPLTSEVVDELVSQRTVLFMRRGTARAFLQTSSGTHWAQQQESDGYVELSLRFPPLSAQYRTAAEV